MEEQSHLGNLVIVFTIVVIVLVISFIVFVVNQKRKQHSMKAIIDLLERQNNEDILEIKADNKKLRDEFERLKNDVISSNKNIQ